MRTRTNGPQRPTNQFSWPDSRQILGKLLKAEECADQVESTEKMTKFAPDNT
jgi:hypothetical protein